MPQSHRTDLTTVAHAYGIAEAMIVVAKQQSAGIYVLPHSLRTLSVSWQWTHAMGGIEVQVMRTDARAAAEILAEAEEPSATRWSRLAIAAAVMALLIAGLPPPGSGLFVLRPLPSCGRSSA